MPCPRIKSRARARRLVYSSCGGGGIGDRATSDGCQPRLMVGIATVDGVEKGGLQRPGQRAAFAVADLTPVDLYNRRDLRAGSDEKRLVGGDHIVARKQFFAYLHL